MALLRWIRRRAGTWACVVVAALTSVTYAVETMAVKAEVVGTTPVALGYNLGHFAENSNAADWFRYSGADLARLFVARKDLERIDDKTPWGDGVTDQATEAAFPEIFLWPMMSAAENPKTERIHVNP